MTGILPAPRTNIEYLMMFNDFMGWVLAFTLIGRPRAVAPEDWPPNFWRVCECGRDYLS